MGGFGSGRTGGKPCTDWLARLDVRKMQRDGCLIPGARFPLEWRTGGEVAASIYVTVGRGRIWLDYRQRQDGDDGQAMSYFVLIDRTPCHYGGERVWLRCPAAGCGRRCAVLYGGAVFACRRCYGLAYRCQRETPDDRATRQAEKIRWRLGWEAGILSGEGRKPKGMHWRTFDRLVAEHDELVMCSLAGAVARFGLL